jgi:predicted Fe-Mo cluster-binding NifX family protein
MIKIAVPITKENQIDSHFGHCESYGVFTVSDNNEIAEVRKVESPQGCGCKSGIASVLASDGVTFMLAGGIGASAIIVLNNCGIEVIRGCSGNASEVIKLYLSGLVKDSGSSCHQHEVHHKQGDSCKHN